MSNRQHVPLTLRADSVAHVCLSPGLYLRSHVTQSTSEEGDVGSISQGGGGKEEVWKPGSFRRGRSLTGGRSASEEKWVAASRGQPATCLPAMALQLQPKPVRLVAPPERGDFPARGQWALLVVGLTSCSPAPATLCVTLANVTSPLLASVSSTKWASAPQTCSQVGF